jgi:hypothetical protein
MMKGMGNDVGYGNGIDPDPTPNAMCCHRHKQSQNTIATIAE